MLRFSWFVLLLSNEKPSRRHSSHSVDIPAVVRSSRIVPTPGASGLSSAPDECVTTLQPWLQKCTGLVERLSGPEIRRLGFGWLVISVLQESTYRVTSI